LRRPLLTFLSLLTALAFAQDLRTVTIRTQPAGAEVYDAARNLVGHGDQPLTLDRQQYGRTPRLYIERPGYVPQTHLVPLGDLDPPVFPEQGALRLEPAHFWVPYTDWARQNPWPTLVLLAGGASLAAAAAAAARRHWSRRRTLRELHAGSTAAREEDSLVMARVGDYLLTDLLGAGGMATVYRAVPADSLAESEAVAVKILHRQAWQNEEFRHRFHREVEAYCSLSHCNIVRLESWGEHNGLAYMALELIRGRTLRELLGRPLPPEEAVRLLEPLCAALQYAHERGILHRDLKPDNLMLTDRGVLKVMDFGLARSWSSGTLTPTGTVMGTPAYMAPEQVQGTAVTARADQYAVGVIAYELLEGRRPFPGDDPIQLLFAHVSQPPPPLERAPRELAVVIERMLAKSPGERFPDMNSVAAALRVGAPL